MFWDVKDHGIGPANICDLMCQMISYFGTKVNFGDKMVAFFRFGYQTAFCFGGR